MSRLVRSLSAATLLITAAFGCGGSHPQQVCQEMVDLIAKAIDRCNPGTYNAAKSTVESTLGGCGRVVQIRDEDSLKNDCYPFLQTTDCTKLQDPKTWPPSCQKQLLLKQ